MGAFWVRGSGKARAKKAEVDETHVLEQALEDLPAADEAAKVQRAEAAFVLCREVHRGRRQQFLHALEAPAQYRVVQRC